MNLIQISQGFGLFAQAKSHILSVKLIKCKRVAKAAKFWFYKVKVQLYHTRLLTKTLGSKIIWCIFTQKRLHMMHKAKNLPRNKNQKNEQLKIAS
jgi:hypothetical protein